MQGRSESSWKNGVLTTIPRLRLDLRESTYHKCVLSMNLFPTRRPLWLRLLHPCTILLAPPQVLKPVLFAARLSEAVSGWWQVEAQAPAAVLSYVPESVQLAEEWPVPSQVRQRGQQQAQQQVRLSEGLLAGLQTIGGGVFGTEKAGHEDLR